MSCNASDHRAIREIVGAALRAEALDLRPTPTGGWSFALANGSTVGVAARIAGGEWLELVASVKGAAVHPADGGWPLLAVNAGLAGTARIAVTPDDSARGAKLRAETFVGVDDDGSDEICGRHGRLAVDVQRVCGDVRTALHHLHDRFSDTNVITDAPALEWPPDAPSAEGTARLLGLCRDAGWPATARVSGDVLVTIEARRTTYQARLAFGTNGPLHAVVPFAEVRRATAPCRAAMATLLLRLGATVRLVKGVLIRHGDDIHPGVAAACVPPRTAADVSRVLQALTVACAIGGREVSALTDEGLARAYLSLSHAHDSVLEARQTDHEWTTKEERTCLQQR